MNTRTAARTTASALPRGSGATGRCTHRWVLGEPHGGAIPALCRRCGARRRYPAGLELPVDPEALAQFEHLDARFPAPADATLAEEYAQV